MKSANLDSFSTRAYTILSKDTNNALLSADQNKFRQYVIWLFTAHTIILESSLTENDIASLFRSDEFWAKAENPSRQLSLLEETSQSFFNRLAGIDELVIFRALETALLQAYAYSEQTNTAVDIGKAIVEESISLVGREHADTIEKKIKPYFTIYIRQSRR